MTQPNACVEGIPNGPVGHPDAVRAIAAALRRAASGEGDLRHAARSVSALPGQMSDWQGVGARAFNGAVPPIVHSLNAVAQNVDDLVHAVDKYATDLDNIQGHPGDGRLDTWWGLVEAASAQVNEVQSLVSGIQQAIANAPPAFSPNLQLSPPFASTPLLGPLPPTNFHVATDRASVLNGTTAAQLAQWENNAWLKEHGYWLTLSGTQVNITNLIAAIHEYGARVKTFNASGASMLDSVGVGAAAAVKSIPGSIGGLAFAPREGDPPIPLSEMAGFTVIVQPGDNLSTIAKTAYGSEDWQKIYAENRAIIGSDPNLLQPGQTLHVVDPLSSTTTISLKDLGITTFAAEPVAAMPIGPVAPGKSRVSVEQAQASTYDPNAAPN